MDTETVSCDVAEEGVTIVKSDVWDTTEDNDDVARPYILPANAVESQPMQQLKRVNSCLVPVPEHELLLHVDSLNHLGSDNFGVEKFSETEAVSDTLQTCSDSDHAVVMDTGCSLPAKEDSLTTKQQIFLWLSRTSTQDIQHSMGSLKNLVNPVKKSYKRSLQDSEAKPSKFFSQKKVMINRNLSTKSLADQFISNPREPGCHSNIKKCETVLAITQEHRCSMEQGDYLSENRIGYTHQCSRAKKCQKISQTCQQISKHGSEIFVRKFKTQNIAPGGLVGMQPIGESLHNFPGLTPVNRLRSTSSNLQCSRYTSIMSVASNRDTSQMSLLLDKRKSQIFNQEELECKICLCDYSTAGMVTLEECRCLFCKECLKQYVTLEIMAGLYDISCPDPDCPTQGVLSQNQMEDLTDKELLDKHRSFRLNTEVSMDTARTWCPSSGCHTICHICTGSKYQGVAVTCPTCVKEFCSLCSASWHAGLSCQEYGGEVSDTFPWDGLEENIKQCPMCKVPIERDEGCAQMMCKRCKHVFCWYCLASLDGDFLLRHYDSGSCQGKLGHSQSSVILHRAQVIGIFAAFGILLLVASPLILVAAPAIICCKCRSCIRRVEKEHGRNVSELADLKVQ